MLHKIFKTRGGIKGVRRCLNYLTGTNEDRTGATILRGNKELTYELAKQSEFENKITAGVLSFEEADVSESVKNKIIDSFEKHVFAGVDNYKDRFNTLWVEHRDKGRLELNYVIVNTDLETNKRFQVYFDRVDRQGFSDFCEIQNNKYKLTSANDPSKKQTTRIDNKGSKDKKEWLAAIDSHLTALYANDKIKNRDDVVKALEAVEGITITRKNSKDSISIEVKNEADDKPIKIRLKGGFYEQEFRSVKEENRADEQLKLQDLGRLNEINDRYNKYIARRGEYNKNKYSSVRNTIKADANVPGENIETTQGATIASDRRNTAENNKSSNNLSCDGADSWCCASEAIVKVKIPDGIANKRKVEFEAVKSEVEKAEKTLKERAIEFIENVKEEVKSFVDSLRKKDDSTSFSAKSLSDEVNKSIANRQQQEQHRAQKQVVSPRRPGFRF